MLVLSRKQNERVKIGEEVWVTVVAIRGDKVRLGFEGPPGVKFNREEVVRRIADAENQTQG